MAHGRGLLGTRGRRLSGYGPRRRGCNVLSLYAAALVLGFFVAIPSAVAEPLRIVAFGDSLTAGLGLDAGDAFPARLEAALTERGHDVEIVNAGVSGDTTSAGLQRLDWAIGEDADGVIVELGANDALRGMDPARVRSALDEILDRLGAKGVEVLLAGMLAPRNLGEDYAAAFDPIFPELAQKHGALLYPFFLEGVATRPDLNQPDGLHPNAEGVEVIVANILPSVEELIARIDARPAD